MIFFCYSVCLYLLCYLQFTVANPNPKIINNYVITNGLDESNVPVKLLDNYLYTILDEKKESKVEVKLYYECLCPDCIDFDKNHFSPVVRILNQYLDIHTYPYGNAQTIEENGHVEFRCQHGPAECYGNKLHACAGDVLGNTTAAVMFNACMMGGKTRGSDDEAADRCGKYFNIDSEPIKVCAKGERGTQLLKYYGEESKKANFNYVPYILINGKLSDGGNFMADVCAAFASPPPPCLQKNLFYTKII